MPYSVAKQTVQKSLLDLALLCKCREIGRCRLKEHRAKHQLRIDSSPTVAGEEGHYVLPGKQRIAEPDDVSLVLGPVVKLVCTHKVVDVCNRQCWDCLRCSAASLVE